MKTEQRGAQFQQQMKAKWDQQRVEEEHMRQFKARPIVLETKLPEKPRKPLTEIDNVTLNSDIRAQKRKLWEAQKQMKEREHEEMLKLQEIELKVWRS